MRHIVQFPQMSLRVQLYGTRECQWKTMAGYDAGPTTGTKDLASSKICNLDSKLVVQK